MAGSRPNVAQGLFGQRKQLDCVELYLPKSLEFLSELYRFLQIKATNRLSPGVLDGFSIYEVDGVFYGEKLWEQRTLVIRLMFIRTARARLETLEGRIADLGREIAHRIAVNEEEIWICHYPQTLTVFRGLKKALT
jgi:hypothetical protein